MNLFSFAKPTKRTYNIQNSIVLYRSKIFWLYCVILRGFLHQVLKPAKMWQITFLIFVHTAFRNALQTTYVPLSKLNVIAKCCMYKYYECNLSNFSWF